MLILAMRVVAFFPPESEWFQIGSDYLFGETLKGYGSLGISTAAAPTSLYSSLLSVKGLAVGSPTTSLSNDEVRHINSFLAACGSRRDVLILPPDFTRFHSQAGMITRYICEYYDFVPKTQDGGSTEAHQPTDSSSVPHIQIIPALGTHSLMTQSHISQMFGSELTRASHQIPSY